jgi:hypothetical protein
MQEQASSVRYRQSMQHAPVQAGLHLKCHYHS